jgi:hypothetical protein
MDHAFMEPPVAKHTARSGSSLEADVHAVWHRVVCMRSHPSGSDLINAGQHWYWNPADAETPETRNWCHQWFNVPTGNLWFGLQAKC